MSHTTTPLRRRYAGIRKRAVSAVGALATLLMRAQTAYRPGVTVLTVNWNSLRFLRVMLDATRAMSPPDTEILVVDNGSSDGSLEYLQGRSDVTVLRLPVNVGHGLALDLAIPRIATEYVALLDVDAFPVSEHWLESSLAALNAGASVAGAYMHRNYIHPCFLVTRTRLLHECGLSFRRVEMRRFRFRKAPLVLDVGESLSQQVILHFGGSAALHRFDITSLRGPGMAGAVFGDLVYHNQGATWGPRQAQAPEDWTEALALYHHEIARAVAADDAASAEPPAN